MVDVNETIPTAHIRITPKVPSIITGTGTVNTIPTAHIRITPIAPGYSKFPLVDILDLNGNKVYEVLFEDVPPGGSSEPQTLILRNNSSSAITFSLTPTVTEDQVGKDIDTVSSTYFSLDLDLWSNSLEVEIPGEDEVTIYIKYNPPSFGKLGEKEWIVVKELDTFTSPTLEGWGFVGLYPVYGSTDGELTDYQVEILVPYHITMNSDFSDIRFLLEDGTVLSYYEKELVEEDYCLFVVKVPTIPVSPGKEDIFIFCGNPDATSESSAIDTYIFGDEMEGVWGDKWETIPGSYQNPWYEVVDGRNVITFNRGSGGKAKVPSFELGFKIEFSCKGTQYNHRLLYCQDSTPNLWTPERYCIDLDVDNRTSSLEGISKNNTFISPTSNVMGKDAWYDCVLIVDEDGNHSLQIGDNPPLTVTDNTYTSGYFAVGHWPQSDYWPGASYFSKLLITKYTPNPPVVGGLEGWNVLENLVIKGKVAYSDGDLPGLDPIVKYGCRVGGVYYE